VSDLKVLIFNPYSRWILQSAYEVALLHNLLDRGHQVSYLTCRGFVGHCDMYWLSVTGERREQQCVECADESANFLSTYKISPLYIDDFSRTVEDIYDTSKIAAGTPVKDLRRAEFKGYNIYNLIISSVQSHLRSKCDFNIDTTPPVIIYDYMKLGIYYIESTLSVLKDIRPDRVFLFNGRMAPTRVMREVSQTNGLSVVSHERSLLRSHIYIFEGAGCSTIRGFGEFEVSKRYRPLNEGQILRVHYWLQRMRGNGGRSFRVFNDTSVVTEWEKINLPSLARGRKICTLFTSSMDEFYASDEFTSCFSSQEDMVLRTIEHAAECEDDFFLIIRVHPNTASKRSLGVNLEELDFFENLKQSVPENVFVISSYDAFDSYQLLDLSNIVVCSLSTIGMEAAAVGKRVAYTHTSIYTECPSVYLVESIEDYKNFLRDDRGEAHLTNDQIKTATYRFLNWLVFELSIGLPFIVQENPNKVSIRLESLTQFKRFRHPALDQLADSVLSGCRSRREQTSMETTEANESIVHRRLASGQNKCLVSIVIPMYNAASTIERCLKSLSSQDSTNCELIIVDDCSTDDGPSFVEKFIRRHGTSFSNVCLIKTPNNSGQPAIPRNLGIASAQGEFVLPLDSDDELVSGWLEKLKATVEGHAEVGVFFSSWIRVDLDGRGKHRETIMPEGIFSTWALLHQNQLPSCSCFSRSAALLVNGYSENVPGYEDWDFWLKLSLAGVLGYKVDGPCYKYHQSDCGLYSKARENHRTLHEKILQNSKVQLQNSGYEDLSKYLSQLVSRED